MRPPPLSAKERGRPYETALTLAPWPSPEVGVAARHAPGPSHSGLPTNLHPMVRPFVSSGRSAPGTGLQAGCGLHGCLRQGVGGGTFNGLAVSWVWMGPQMHWHINCLELLAEHLALNHLKRRLRGEHLLTLRPLRTSTDKMVYTPVATRPPPPPLESEASEVAS